MEKNKEIQLILDQAAKGMGFAPNSLYKMGVKPNILGAFSMLFANVRGFSGGPEVSPLTGLKLTVKNLIWTLKAKKNNQNEVPLYLKNLVSYISSNAAGCRYCQAHTALEAHENGVAIEKIQAIWAFQTSDLFTDKEKAALNFALAASSTPNQVTQEHHSALEKHFSEPQIVELMATISIFGFLNRWNDSMATELEALPLAFAEKHLSDNWDVGKHKRN